MVGGSKQVVMCTVEVLAGPSTCNRNRLAGQLVHPRTVGLPNMPRHLPTLHPLLNGVCNGLGIAGSQVGWVHSAARALHRGAVRLSGGSVMGAARVPYPVPTFILAGREHRPLVAGLESCCSRGAGRADQRASSPPG